MLPRSPLHEHDRMKTAVLLAASALAMPAAAADLTPTESRWLNTGWPVIAYAKAQELPLDIVVLPRARKGDVPLAMGFDNGRCKLVLAMRGNPDAESTLDALDPALLPAVVETMFAHELGHCWRYAQGVWHAWPSGFHDPPDGAGADPRWGEQSRTMRDTRREEAFADLVGLAWTLSRHPAQYEQVHGWLEDYRADQPVPGAHHDTRLWVCLARDPRAFGHAETPFEQADALWREGLLGGACPGMRSGE